jgi:glycosyltransferase involved in cell wall biosynthesis
VVDDASSDDSGERVRRLAAGDPRVRVFRLDANRGPSGARNHALGHARGAMIAYLDHDDEYYPDYLALVNAWRARADMLVFANDLVEERPGAADLGRTWTHNPVPLRARLLEKNIATPLGVAHSRALLDKVGLFDTGIPVEHDWDLWKRFHRAGAVFLFTDRKSGLYHVRAGSVSRTVGQGTDPR